MSSYKLYSRINDRDTVLELWGGSTKHPDSVFHYSDFKKSCVCDDNHPMQLTLWICECASKLTFPFHGIALVNWAMNNLREWVVSVDGDADAWDQVTAL